MHLLDQEADACWGALRMRLQAYVVLPPSRFPNAKRAQALVITLFGSAGLAFLTSTDTVEAATMDTLLQRIDADGLQPQIDELCGPDFLAAIRVSPDRDPGRMHPSWPHDDGRAVYFRRSSAAWSLPFTVAASPASAPVAAMVCAGSMARTTARPSSPS